MCEVRIYLTNLARYNSGELFGKWIDLPMEDDDLKQAVKDVLGSDEEFFITDYEAPFSIGEYENLHELNDFARQLQDLDEQEQEKVTYLLDVIGCNREEAIKQYEDVIFYPEMTLKEVAEELVEEGCFGTLSDNIKGYLDYESIGRDLGFDGYHETEKGTFWYC